ncbi:MAG: [Fe-Fe] hydrogenase large subunit C-terminal domain-containing protein [Rikenellaceae bacterium]
MERNTNHRALEIRGDVCVGCSHCMKVCPTEALRVSGGKATLYSDWCIDCGECFRICESRAIRVVDDDFNRVLDYKHSVLLVPTIFFAQFQDKLSVKEVCEIIGDLGFSEICAVEQSVDVLIDDINEYVEKATKPVISSFCPAVTRLIQVRFPSLVDHLMLLIPPLEATAQLYIRKYGVSESERNDLGIFYLTPCIAKIAAVKSPVGGYVSPINGVINMDYLYNKVYMAYKQRQKGSGNVNFSEAHSRKGVLWSTTGGEAANIKGRTLAIDGMSNVIEFLEKLENDEISDVDFLELRVCDESCAGGILVQGNRFLITESMKKIASNSPFKNVLLGEYKKYCSSYTHIDKVEPRSMIKYDKDIVVALRKMEEAASLRDRLPGIDCGACGAPSCEALAGDIVRGDATINNCIFMQTLHEKEGSLNFTKSIEIMEHVWGKDRFMAPKIEPIATIKELNRKIIK